MKKIKLLLVLLVLSTAESANAQTPIILKDRVYWLPPFFHTPKEGILNQAKIIDGYIYTIETWNNWPYSYGISFIGKYDLNGNLIKRRPHPFDMYYDELPHDPMNSVPIFKTGADLVIFQPIRFNPGSGGLTDPFLYKISKDLDSIKYLSFEPDNDSLVLDVEERFMIQTSDGKFLMLSGLKQDKITLRKIDGNLNEEWKIRFGPTNHLTYELYNGANLKTRGITEAGSNYYISDLRFNSLCVPDNLPNDTSCGNSRGEIDLHLTTISNSGNLLQIDSINLPVFPFTPNLTFIIELISEPNGFRLLLNSHNKIYVVAIDTTLRKSELISSYDGGLNSIRSEASYPFLKCGFVKFSDITYHHYNADHTNAFLNAQSISPFPDSLEVFLNGRLQKITGYSKTWYEEQDDGSILLHAKIAVKDSGDYLAVLPLNNVIGTFTVNGYKDLVPNCTADAGDVPASGKLIKLTKANPNIAAYAQTDASGKIKMYLDSGQYTSEILPPNFMWDNCPDSHSFSITAQDDSVHKDFFLNKTVLCPLLNIYVSSDRIRPCFNTNNFVKYCNNGTITAVDAYAEITLDSATSVISSSLPYTHSENVYTFQLGNIDEETCNTFTFETTLDCAEQIGTNHCITAHIYPDSSCLPVSSSWDKSQVAVDGRCLGDSIEFRIRNIGSGNMIAAKNYFITENISLVEQQSFQLNAGQQLLIHRSANGSMQRIAAQQSDSFPYPSNPSYVVSDCGGPSNITSNAFPHDDAADFIDINCLLSISSYDPNDKAGIPSGVNAQHLISKGTDIEYKIRFQNTGTDTAYDIYILDTLSTLLDIASLQMSASSHPYTYEIYGPGILKVVFRNINLVDSFHNEALSHGFFTYRIGQDSTTKNNDQIHNTAHIYFDENSPVATNTTLHTVSENLFSIISSVIENKWNATATAYPNPFRTNCTIIIKSDKVMSGMYDFKLYNLAGQLVRQERIKEKIELNANDLSSNIYLYRIEYNGELINAGKIVKE